jgi:hypothetical protein
MIVMVPPGDGRGREKEGQTHWLLACFVAGGSVEGEAGADGAALRVEEREAREAVESGCP